MVGGFDVTRYCGPSRAPVKPHTSSFSFLSFSTFPVNDAAFRAVVKKKNNNSKKEGLKKKKKNPTQTRDFEFILGLTEWKLGRFSLQSTDLTA